MAFAPFIGDCRWDSKGEAVSINAPIPLSLTQPATREQHWYAVQTRSRHEKSVTTLLQTYGIHAYLPLVPEVHEWSDRRKTVQVPLFSGYVFVHTSDSNDAISRIIRTEGVVFVLGNRSRGTPIPSEEIDSIKALLTHKIPYRNHSFLEIGQRVRIRGGALNGVEGILLEQKSETSLVISVNMIQRSLAMRVDGYEIEAI
jgi:transcription antitermination factor NusG